ncbi:MAG TPA: rod shape-determining protein MreD [Flavobacteriaceae bacterium]|jgi:rod shape-determining protein MreD|nr:rod shape-determining protein MreD [Flavobacteriaceae bacterium]HBS12492.1 rod shape-determining protein MreD [Flavobacteriaceae bacterium]
MNDIFKYSFLFIALILIQIIVLNNILFLGYINPFLYILFIVVFPFRRDRGFILILSFILGLIIDFFSDSGGINAAATLAIAYIRLPLIKGLLRKTEIDFLVFNILKTPFSKLLSFIAILTFTHHFILFSLDYFKFSELLTILSRTILTSVFTIILIIFSLLLMNKNK